MDVNSKDISIYAKADLLMIRQKTAKYTSLDIYIQSITPGGSVVECLGRATRNADVPCSSPALATSWSCFSVALSSTPRPRL